MTHADFIRERYTLNAWRRMTGLAEIAHARLPDVRTLRRSEWSASFERLQRNRLLGGAYRYGRLNAPGKPKYDRVSDIIRRAKLYRATGNDEHLVDVANLAMCEFEEGQHPQKHFTSADDGIHTAVA